VAEDLDERVLHRLVGVCRVVEILVRNPKGAPLMPGDQARKLLAGLVDRVAGDQLPDLDREKRIV
jgi:hypothetical protein